MRFASRFLRGLWEYTHASIAAAAEAPADAEAAADTAFIRERLGKWGDNGLERIGAGLEGLQKHKAGRNITPLLGRIKDYGKRNVGRRGQLGPGGFQALLGGPAPPRP